MRLLSASRQAEWIVAVFLSVACAGLLLVFKDLKTTPLLVTMAGLAGLSVLAALPNRRIVLVGAWVFLHPLSIQKAFQMSEPQFPGFMPPFYVVCASDVALFLLLLELLREAVTSDSRPFYWPAAATPLAFLTAWVILDFLLVQPSVDGVLQVTHWLKLLLALIAFSSAIRTRHEMLLVLAVIGLTLALQCAVVFTTLVVHREFSFAKSLDPDNPIKILSTGAVRATGTAGGPNQQAQFHTFLTIPLLGLCWLRNFFWRSFFMLVIALSLAATALTYCRAAWIACALAIATAMYFAYRKGFMTRRLWAIAAAGGLAGIIALTALAKPIVTRFGKDDDGSSASRMRMIRTSEDYIAHYPLTGVGPGNFVEHQLVASWADWLPNRFQPRRGIPLPPNADGVEMFRFEWRGHWVFQPLVVHNKYLLVISELGYIGLALFLWYEWRVVKQCIAAMQATQDVARWTGIGLCAAVFGSLFFFLFDLFYQDTSVITPIFMNSLAIAAARMTAREKALES